MASSLLPRWVHQFYARRMGYFWLRCSICREYLGGHEWDTERGLRVGRVGNNYYQGACNDCLDEAERRNLEWGN